MPPKKPYSDIVCALGTPDEFRKNQAMSAGHITEGKWNQIKGSVKERWGDLTDDEYKESEGKIDQLAGKIEEKYGHARREVAEQLDKLTDDDHTDSNSN